jgi:glycerol dehydrogenase
MSKIIISPSKYVQGPGELKKLEDYTKTLGGNVLVIASSNGIKRVKDKIDSSFKESNSNVNYEAFNGECSKIEIERLKKLAEEKKTNVIAGVGGGKTLDTAKAVGHYMKIPVVIVPTIASTDAPCSALSVIYKENGEFEEYLVLPKNPEAVIMDTEVIAASPSRLTISGMGDALATYFEARSCVKSQALTMAGGTATEAAFALARLCYEILITEGFKAKLAAEAGCVTEAFEKIIEANTLLSGIGFESCGLAASHAIHNGFTVLEECHHLYHGEKVAFGTIAQLVIENAPLEEIEEVVYFCKQVGLPTTLEEMGVKEVTKEKIMKVAEASSAEGETIYNMGQTINADVVYAAIMTADGIGKNL